MSKQINIRISDEVAAVLDDADNKTKYIEDAVLAKSQDEGVEAKFKLISHKLDLLLDAPEHNEISSPPPVPDYMAQGMERACCLAKSPCQHWQWDGDESAYINTLSGKKRESAS